MRKLLFLLLFPCMAHAGTLTIYQDQGGAIGSVLFHPVGQVFFDTSTTSGHPSGVGDMNWNMTIGPNQNRYAIVGCAMSLNDVPSSVLINGNSMTLLISTQSTTQQTGAFIYGYANPDSGNVGITISYLSGIVDRGVCSALSLYGVNQSNTIDISTATVNNAAGGTDSLSFTTTAPNEAVFDIFADINTDTLTPGSGQAAIMNNTLSFWAVGSSTRTVNSAGAYSMSWTTVQNPVAHAAISLRPAQ